jgi:hypothetical protein
MRFGPDGAGRIFAAVVAMASSFRPPLDRLGFHRLSAALLALQIGALLLAIWAFWVTGLSFLWRGLLPLLPFPAIAVVAWGYLVWMPGRKANTWIYAEMFLIFVLLFAVTDIVVPAQYAAAALGRPLADPWLAAADAALGVHVPTLVLWTRTHPWLIRVLSLSYNSLIPQLFLLVFLLGFWYRDRATLWEYAFHYHVCLVGAIVCFALFPAACPFSFYGFESILDHTRFLAHFGGVRAGLMTAVDPSNTEGLVSFPSFHTAGALMATWAVRRSRIWLTLLGVLNMGLIAATVLLGIHYVIDLLGAVALCGVSLALYRVLVPIAKPAAAGEILRPVAA